MNWRYHSSLGDWLLLQCAALLISFLIFVPHFHAQTQATMNAQARSDFVQADTELNKTYQSVLAKLPAAEKQKLKQEQRAWVASRDAEAARAAKESEGGSMAPTLRYETMTDLTRKRITELKAMIDKESASGAHTEASQSPNKQASSVSQAEPNPRTTPASISPDKKWEYQESDDATGPKIVRAGTNEVALDLSDDECSGFPASVIWSPDSKRFAFECHMEGRSQGGSSLYQLHGDKWKALKSPNDDVRDVLNKVIAAKLKESGLPKKTDLRLIWEKVEVHQGRWVDSSTVILYGALEEAVRETLEGFGAHFLVTLKFDPQGNWKIVKTHRLSEKELEKKEKEQ
jgi:uncharacterized protein YecT (DUF1311 family)